MYSPAACMSPEMRNAVYRSIKRERVLLVERGGKISDLTKRLWDLNFYTHVDDDQYRMRKACWNAMV
ncbi:hypothetical protein BDN71DRAFT_1438988 [Pleurotus eryngii]|uniref:Uncharacterized protein n=1 Tax=Pleurotus eryngii TaxID=5323 RepID=A0A9P6AB82_PLEER|nr:hypothetical protein BDN71DRAFT_1438988 [Pleurotus eryngii]